MTTIFPSRRDVLRAATTLAAASSVAAVGGPSAQSAEAEPALSPALGQVDQAFRQAVDAKVVPSVVAIAATDKGIIYEGAFGPSITPDTVHWIASMSKAVCATACMQLVEQGKLQLDQTMGKLIPQLEKPMVLEGFDASGAPKLRPAKRPITLRHLLTHTSGYSYAAWNANVTKWQKATGVPDIGSYKNAAFNDPPLMFDPGDRWEYGMSIDWVGKAVEAVTDTSLEIYYRENILEPLSMKDSGFLLRSKQRARIAPCYHREADGSLAFLDVGSPQRPEFFMAGGGMFSTPRDYIVLLQMLLHDGTFNGVQILKPESVAAMRQNQIGDLVVLTEKTVVPYATNDFNMFPDMAHKFGLTFDINPEPGPSGRSAGSYAWAGFFNEYFWVDPVKRVAGVFMTQLLPFFDEPSLKLFGEFESSVYKAMASS